MSDAVTNTRVHGLLTDSKCYVLFWYKTQASGNILLNAKDLPVGSLTFKY